MIFFPNLLFESVMLTATLSSHQHYPHIASGVSEAIVCPRLPSAFIAKMGFLTGFLLIQSQISLLLTYIAQKSSQPEFLEQDNADGLTSFSTPVIHLYQNSHKGCSQSMLPSLRLIMLRTTELDKVMEK